MNVRFAHRCTPLAVVALSSALPRDALAHPGHGMDTAALGLLHFATSLSHGAGAPFFAILLVLAAGIAWRRRA